MASKEWYDDVNTTAFLWAGIISVLVFIVAVLGVQGAYYAFDRYEQGLRNEREPVKSLAVLKEQREGLAEYKKYKDLQNETKIAIPIDRAMDLVSADLLKGE